MGWIIADRAAGCHQMKAEMDRVKESCGSQLAAVQAEAADGLGKVAGVISRNKADLDECKASLVRPARIVSNTLASVKTGRRSRRL